MLDSSKGKVVVNKEVKALEWEWGGGRETNNSLHSVVIIIF